MPKRFTKETFIGKSKEVHGDKYDYSKVKYVNSVTKVCIVCPVHGDFWVRPADHIHSKVGCPRCSGLKKSNTEEFIEKARKKYGDKYDYSKVNYVNSKTKVCIVCHEKDVFGNEHGEFWQRPNDHLNGYACPKCAQNHIPTTSEWVKMARLVHGDKYDYSKVNYVDAVTKVCIVCPEHGEFWQRPTNHIYLGAGCPDCNSNAKSRMEEKVFDNINELGIKIERQKTFDWLKYKRNLYLDFYLPTEKLAIEVQGDQHFAPIEKFGGMTDFELRKKRDYYKKKLCEEHGIKVFYVTKRNDGLKDVLNYLNETTRKE